MFAIEVALPVPLHKAFTYLSKAPVARGARVLAPFGSRKMVGVVLGPAVNVDPAMTLKEVHEVLDPEPLYSETMLKMAYWLEAYYMHPLGEVLKTMLPASEIKSKTAMLSLSDEGQSERAEGLTPEGRLIRRLFGTQKDARPLSIIRKKYRDLALAMDADCLAVSLESLLELGLLEKNDEKKLKGRTSFKRSETARDSESVQEAVLGPEPPKALTSLQKEAYDRIVREGFGSQGKPILLRGVTGSGKTEIYLHLIRWVLDAAGPVETPGRGQTLVLVPEISLTPQMTRIFERRFPGRVAVVHSAMPDAERWAQLDLVRRGDVDILIGPRSAVFGPFRQLSLIIVDEEHDGSYKQSTGLTYNGRDVAVLRGQLEKAAVILGSATPSMESYFNAQNGKYHLIEIGERVTGRPLPEVEVVGPPEGHRMHRSGAVVGDRGEALPLDPETDEIPINPLVLERLRENFGKGHQSIVLVNRRGFAYFLMAASTKNAVECPDCRISLTLHARSTILRCHYCDYSTTLKRILSEHPHETFVAFGYGSQRAEDYLVKKLSEAKIARIDSDAVMKKGVLPRILGDFRSGQIDILVGTQILAKGHDFPKVTLIALLDVDQMLNLPDFRAGERTFQLIVQAAGRAGRANLAGQVLIQCTQARHPLVQSAIAQDYAAFAAAELAFREAMGYPPFARMILFELNAPKREPLDRLAQGLEAWFEQLQGADPSAFSRVKVLGPATPAMAMLRGRHRLTLTLLSKDRAALRKFSTMLKDYLKRLPPGMRLTIDVDPQSMM